MGQCIRTGGYPQMERLFNRSVRGLIKHVSRENKKKECYDILYTSTLCSCISCRSCARRALVSTVPMSMAKRGRELEKNLNGLSGRSDRKDVQGRRMGCEKSMDAQVVERLRQGGGGGTQN